MGKIEAKQKDGNSNIKTLTHQGHVVNVNTIKDYGAIVAVKDNATISGAYQFNSVLGDVKKGDKITLEVRSNSASSGWSCVVGFSFDGTYWKDTISDINAVASDHHIVEIDVIAPYWRFVFINTGVSSNWTIKYVI